MNDVNGVEVKLGDTVHCWDGDIDQREVTQSLRGIVNADSDNDKLWRVGDNMLALGCAEHVEVI